MLGRSARQLFVSSSEGVLGRVVRCGVQVELLLE